MATNETSIGQIGIATHYQQLREQKVESWPILTLSKVLRALTPEYLRYIFVLIYWGYANEIPGAVYSTTSISINLELLSHEIRQVLSAYLNQIGAVYQPSI